MDTMLTPQEVAEKLNISPNTVKKLWREGRLRGSQISERKIRFKPSDVEDFLRRSAGPEAPEPAAQPKESRDTFRMWEDNWCEEHRDELLKVAGQWVVIQEPYGLVAHHWDLNGACDEARAKGVKIPYVFYMGHPDPPGTVRIGMGFGS